jgi:flavin-dependent dehydrogenase
VDPYDVVVCGGGLAGLTLARQLKLELGDVSVAVVDRESSPLPEAAHKVGESTVELASLYLQDVLYLREYLQKRHLPKLGLRLFFGDAHGPFEARPETGPSLLPPVTTYQIDRGRLENDLRRIVVDMGVELIEGAVVDDIVVSDDGGPHMVRVRRRASSERLTLRGRWAVDALGRRRLLQTKLGLGTPNGHDASAAWWRVEGRVDLAEAVADRDGRWRRRIIDDRTLSTTQLMGRGYWVWLIPLASGATSVGIVTDETIHPFRSYGRNHGQALSWLHAHEPALWRLIAGRPPLDFHGLRGFSYHTQQLFSCERWACTGEAGFFLDPLYSLGSDFIAIDNTIITELVRRDRAGEMTQDGVDDLNRLVLDVLAPCYLDYYKGTYRSFGHAQIYTVKLAWDTALYWALLVQLFQQGAVRRPTPAVFDVARRYSELNHRVQRLFADWAEEAPPHDLFVPHGDLTRMKFLQLLHLELTTRRSPEQMLEVAERNLDRFDELAQVLFWRAVAECRPERLPARGPLPRVDTTTMTLDPQRWESENVLRPSTGRRRSLPMSGNVAGIFAPLKPQEWLSVELPYRLLHLDRGRVVYPFVRLLHRRLVSGRPAMYLRRLFVVERRCRGTPPRRHPAGSGLGAPGTSGNRHGDAA